jgi:hypothetical protein
LQFSHLYSYIGMSTPQPRNFHGTVRANPHESKAMASTDFLDATR